MPGCIFDVFSVLWSWAGPERKDSACGPVFSVTQGAPIFKAWLLSPLGSHFPASYIDATCAGYRLRGELWGKAAELGTSLPD